MAPYRRQAAKPSFKFQTSKKLSNLLKVQWQLYRINSPNNTINHLQTFHVIRSVHRFLLNSTSARRWHIVLV